MNNLSLTKEEQSYLLSQFPNVKPSYDMKYKKVDNNQSCMYIAVPVGIPCLLWFTYVNVWNEFACFVLEYDKSFTVMQSMYPIEVGFHDSLGYGTILQGTWFSYSIPNECRYQRCFSVEDVLQYKGKIVTCSWINRISMLEQIASIDCNSLVLTRHQWLIKLPVMSTHPYFSSKELAYTIDYIRAKQGRKSIQLTIELEPTPPSEQYIKSKYFFLTMGDGMDIYQIWEDEHLQQFVGTALILSYECSQWMHVLFQNKRVYWDLDHLEDSDDESENQSLSTSSTPTIVWKIQCHFHSKFGKWVPSERFAIRVR